MSGASFVGLIGASYAHGLVIFHYEWTAALVLVVFAAIILPVFLRARLFTVTEYLERRFEPRTRRLYSIFTLVTLLFIDMAGALYAGAIVMVTGLPFLDLWTACLIISLLTGLYTILGGCEPSSSRMHYRHWCWSSAPVWLPSKVWRRPAAGMRSWQISTTTSSNSSVHLTTTCCLGRAFWG